MKFERVEGNVPIFSGEYEGRDRTIFGGTEQSNDINQQFTPEFIKGWGIVGKNEFPTLQDFNALGFTHSALIGYLYQSGVAQWVAGADYYTGSVAVQGVDLYVAIQDKPTSQPSSLQGWRLVSPALLNTTGNSTGAPMTQKATTDAINKKWDIQTTTGSGNVARMSEVQKKWDIQTTTGSGNVARMSEVTKKADSTYVNTELAKKWDIQTTTGSGNVARMSEVEKKWNSSKFIDHGYMRNYGSGETYTAREDLGVLGWGYGISISHNLVDDGTNIHIDGRSVSNDIYIIRYKKTENGEDEKLHKLITDVNTSADSSGFLRTSGSKETFTKDLVTQSPGSSTTSVMSQKAVTDRFNSIESGHGLGYEQTWVDVKSQRVAGATYTNNTGKPIFIIVTIGGGEGNAKIFVDGVGISFVDRVGSSITSVYAIIPNGSSYIASASISLAEWFELR